MAIRSTALPVADSVEWDLDDHEERAATYGGLVGEMLEGIEARMGSARIVQPIIPLPEDGLHYLSVAAGYTCLISGFAIAGYFIYNIFQHLM